MNNSYLPIGSIVNLKGGTKKIMITGFCCFSDNKMYDYTGCLYPEGYISLKKMLVFNSDQIEKIHYIGPSNDEEKHFKQELNKLVNQIKNKEGMYNDVK